MKIVIPEPLKKGLLLVLLGLGMQPAQTQCTERQPTQEEFLQGIQQVVSNKGVLKNFLAQNCRLAEPELTQKVNQLFNKPEELVNFLEQLNAHPKQTPRPKARKKTNKEVVDEFQKIVNFANNSDTFSKFLCEKSGPLSIGYPTIKDITAQREELEQRFALYRFIKPAAIGFGSLALVLAGCSWWRWFREGSTAVIDKEKTGISKSALLDRITELENRQKLLALPSNAVAVQAPVKTGSYFPSIGSMFKTAIGLTGFAATMLVKATFSDIGLHTLSSFGLTPASWILKNYPFPELFSSVPSLPWMLDNQFEFRVHYEMVFAQLVNRKEQSQSFVDSITGVEKPKVIEEYSFLDPFKVCFERVKKRQSEYAACMQAAVNETTQQKQLREQKLDACISLMRGLEADFTRLVELYCNHEDGAIVKLAHDVGLLMRDVEKILGYMSCRFKTLPENSSRRKTFVSNYVGLFKLANNMVYGMHKRNFDAVYNNLLQLEKNINLSKEIFN